MGGCTVSNYATLLLVLLDEKKTFIEHTLRKNSKRSALIWKDLKNIGVLSQLPRYPRLLLTLTKSMTSHPVSQQIIINTIRYFNNTKLPGFSKTFQFSPVSF